MKRKGTNAWQAAIVDHNNNPISDVKIYEDTLENKEATISNKHGDFQFYNGICDEITLKFITLDGENYMKKYASKSIPKITILDYKE
ncbi:MULTISPECIES: hypothetical protein [Bacillus cereus group]|uniref:Carboxypeptidase regulatory-like domain-containing protein n=1 Tax=Bacillus cereus VD048 TaxID=1053226 RepID=J8I5J7_BACCE|nr:MULTISPECIES: hypothetical protein [Bacillus cereus group]EJR33680.1 hypothetical protein IIG_02352 [Bacillus cereus VD048]WJE37175.1 hypothetical protein QRX95_12815 [Bacillus mycoides]